MKAILAAILLSISTPVLAAETTPAATANTAAQVQGAPKMAQAEGDDMSTVAPATTEQTHTTKKAAKKAKKAKKHAGKKKHKKSKKHTY